MLRTLVGALALLCSAVVALPSWAAEADDDPVDRVLAAIKPINFPTQPPRMSNDCSSRTVAGDQFRRPLKGLRRAIRI